MPHPEHIRRPRAGQITKDVSRRAGWVCPGLMAAYPRSFYDRSRSVRATPYCSGIYNPIGKGTSNATLVPRITRFGSRGRLIYAMGGRSKHQVQALARNQGDQSLIQGWAVEDQRSREHGTGITRPYGCQVLGILDRGLSTYFGYRRWQQTDLVSGRAATDLIPRPIINPNLRPIFWR
ncbi:hypothetical protein H0G86_010737 [Trichoderma simmonsii]|uniref:Uncharacterized protein n=1 Tax=Trichoderma simmonsii TaxID=1491479 RepID=A0A8G0PP91_9HYPO|nr:hypothetical protein H0G86_010737 [Trichoderma simmonsii]